MVTRREWLRGTAALAGAGLLPGLPRLLADEAKPGEMAEPPASVPAVQQIALADALVGYAREHKVPEALLTAVDIYRRTPAEEFKGKLEGDAQIEKAKPLAARLEELLTEARKIRPDDKDLAGLVDRARQTLKETTRALVGGGPAQFDGRMASGGSVEFTRDYAPTGGALALLPLTPKRFKVEVRNPQGALVAQDVFTTLGASRGQTLRFPVAARGLFRFRVKDLDVTAPGLQPGRFRITLS